ncbi:hypothetical protein CJ226_16560 [Microbacterium sp. UMB0228]|nr:hypothetical protein CJ226_16560 [Microbacterium sp. UMB0228]
MLGFTVGERARVGMAGCPSSGRDEISVYGCLVAAAWVLGRRGDLVTNVTIALSYVGDDELPADDPGSTRADSSWALALERFITFPPWTIETPEGPEYALWWEARQGSDCEDGLRQAPRRGDRDRLCGHPADAVGVGREAAPGVRLQLLHERDDDAPQRPVLRRAFTTLCPPFPPGGRRKWNAEAEPGPRRVGDLCAQRPRSGRQLRQGEIPGDDECSPRTVPGLADRRQERPRDDVGRHQKSPSPIGGTAPARSTPSSR